jgi:hypothetical protein
VRVRLTVICLDARGICDSSGARALPDRGRSATVRRPGPTGRRRCASEGSVWSPGDGPADGVRAASTRRRVSAHAHALDEDGRAGKETDWHSRADAHSCGGCSDEHRAYLMTFGAEASPEKRTYPIAAVATAAPPYQQAHS